MCSEECNAEEIVDEHSTTARHPTAFSHQQTAPAQSPTATKSSTDSLSSPARIQDNTTNASQSSMTMEPTDGLCSPEIADAWHCSATHFKDASTPMNGHRTATPPQTLRQHHANALVSAQRAKLTLTSILDLFVMLKIGWATTLKTSLIYTQREFLQLCIQHSINNIFKLKIALIGNFFLTRFHTSHNKEHHHASKSQTFLQLFQLISGTLFGELRKFIVCETPPPAFLLITIVYFNRKF